VKRAAFALAALALGAAPRSPLYEREIRPSAPGRTFVVLDRDVYEGAEVDLRDLRVIDDQGQTVPYRLDRGEPGRTGSFRPQQKNRAFVRGQTETVTLDFGGPVGKRRLALRLSGDNFRRRIAVEGSQDGGRWVTLVDGSYVFAVPPPEAARYETVELPPNDFPLLRLTVFHGPDDPEHVDILDVSLGEEAGRAPEVTMPITPLRMEDEKRHETLLTFDLGARYQPFQALVLDVGDNHFFRGVEVEARRESLATKTEPSSLYWISLGESAVYRYDEGGKVRERLRVDVRGRERALRLRIRNRDDRPLELRGVLALAPVERLLFEAAPNRGYRLTYGTPDRGAPEYDLARTVTDLAEWAANATPASLDPPPPLPPPPDRRPWSEKHPALLWVALLAVVVILGLLTWGALRRAS